MEELGISSEGVRRLMQQLSLEQKFGTENAIPEKGKILNFETGLSRN